MNLTQIGGDATVNRTFFGWTAYSIPLASDGVVPLSSAQGYAVSGPSGQPPIDGAKSHSRRDTCTVDFGLVNRAAHNLSFVPASMALDYLTLQDLQKDRFGPQVQAYLGGVTIAAACSHIRLPTDQSAIDQATEVIKAALVELNKMPEQGATRVVNVVGVDKSGDPAAGALVCWVGSDRRELLCGGDPWEKRLHKVVSTTTVPAVSPPAAAEPWGLELDGGAKCLLRNGGSGESAFVLVTSGDRVVNTDSPTWTVQVGGLGAANEAFPPPTTKKVRTAYFAAAP